jgi:formylglycine-generating enzyme required for sulfatase activity
MCYSKKIKRFVLLLFAVIFSVAVFGQENEKNLTFTAKNINFEMVFVEGGTFTMGCTSEQNFCFGDEKAVHTVELKDYYIGKYQVTQKIWHEVMGRSIRLQLYMINGKTLNGEGNDFPVYYVNYAECEEFCSQLNKLFSKQLPKGYKFCLPTEAQWEYAARGGNQSRSYCYSGSTNIDEIGWYADNSGSTTHKIGMRKPNELGIFDMSGNVFEWCRDWYNDLYYFNSPSINPTGPDTGRGRVLRGGSWICKLEYCRVSFRHCTSPSNRSFDVGVRLALAQ